MHCTQLALEYRQHLNWAKAQILPVLHYFFPLMQNASSYLLPYVSLSLPHSLSSCVNEILLCDIQG